MVHYPAIVTGGRILMGPGPSNVHPRVVFGIIEIQRTAAKMSQEKLKIKKA